MIYCNFTDKSRPAKCQITGKGAEIRDELSAILIELLNTGIGEHLIHDAYRQAFDPEWQETFDKEIREFPDLNRRRS
ncbi:hypothetical protein [Galactobacillus timonensis]|uniref:hypothetical protein n=1 Tax=Galactobacillus timonensis TaxID=2041840 RepID=UPI000C83E4E4|nr:hypothetical protein [Galactobacillus timonensis]